MRDIIETAREAGIDDPESDWMFWNAMERFAAFVRADERNRTWTQEHWTEYERSIAAQEREACARRAEIALRGGAKVISDHVLKAIRVLGST
jgi:hypothetical protein